LSLSSIVFVLFLIEGLLIYRDMTSLTVKYNYLQLLRKKDPNTHLSIVAAAYWSRKI